MSDDPTIYQLDTSSYQRPNSKWNCGRAAEGLPCTMGPDGSGECGAVCTPYQEGERYYCGNASAMGGKCASGPLPDGTCCQMPALCKPAKQAGTWVCRRGMCEEGPLPDGTCCRPFGSCRPTRSIFARRKQVTTIVFALAVAALLVMVGGPAEFRKSATSPGKLSSHHRHFEKQCSECHKVGDGNAEDWMQAAFAPGTKDHQSALCLQCHDLGRDAMFAHSLSTEDLAQATERILAEKTSGSEPWLLHVARIDRPEKKDKLACATCHHEHHGEQIDLKQMTDLQCQICHAKAFHSFVKGHAEFTNFPYDRRTRLYFDHAAHLGQHFQESKRFRPGEPVPSACVDCHETGPKQKLMTVKSFEQMCASCHDQQIRAPKSEGIVFFSLPAIDVPSLRAKGFGDIGQWPVTYPKHVEAAHQTSPLTHLLLESHSDFADAAQALEGVDLSDLGEASPARLKQVQEYVWAMKNALVQLRVEGHQGFQQHLAGLLSKGQLNESNTDTYLIGSMLYDKVLEAQARWLPNLKAEIEARGASSDKRQPAELEEDHWKKPLALDLTLLETERAHIAQLQMGWYLRDVDLSLRYRPVGHDDPWLVAWINASASGSTETDATHSLAKQRVFAEFASPTAPGRCMKCHTADLQPEGGLRIHWRSKEISFRKEVFTDFTHWPHQDRSCQTCHTLQEPSDSTADRGIFRTEFIHLNGTLNTSGNQLCSDFTAIQKATCAECHSKGMASQSCLTCHNYHVGIHGRRLRNKDGK